MSGIIITGQDEDKGNVEENSENQEPLEINYAATEEDEERFFLMYNLHMQPSEVEKLSPDYRRWLIARFITQKKMEQEMLQRHRLMQTLGPDLKSGPGLNLVR